MRAQILAAIAANEARHAELTAMLGEAAPAHAPVPAAAPSPDPEPIQEVRTAAPMRADYVAPAVEAEPVIEVSETDTAPLAGLLARATPDELEQIQSFLAKGEVAPRT